MRIPVVRLMEKDEAKVSQWFDLDAGQALEGLVVGERDQQRVYEITTDAPEGQAQAHGRWPVAADLQLEIRKQASSTTAFVHAIGRDVNGRLFDHAFECFHALIRVCVMHGSTLVCDANRIHQA